MAKEKATLTKLMPSGPASVTIGGQAVGDASEWFVDDRSTVTMPLLLDDFRLQNIRESAKTLPAYFDTAFLLRLIDERDMIISDLLRDKGDISQTALGPRELLAANQELHQKVLARDRRMEVFCEALFRISRLSDTFGRGQDISDLNDLLDVILTIASGAMEKEYVE